MAVTRWQGMPYHVTLGLPEDWSLLPAGVSDKLFCSIFDYSDAQAFESGVCDVNFTVKLKKILKAPDQHSSEF